MENLDAHRNVFSVLINEHILCRTVHTCIDDLYVVLYVHHNSIVPQNPENKLHIYKENLLYEFAYGISYPLDERIALHNEGISLYCLYEL